MRGGIWGTSGLTRVCGRNEDTALHLAVVRGSLKCVVALLCSDSHVQPLTRNKCGWNALHYAVQLGVERLDILRAILAFRPRGNPGQAAEEAIGNLHPQQHARARARTSLSTHTHARTLACARARKKAKHSQQAHKHNAKPREGQSQRGLCVQQTPRWGTTRNQRR